MRLLGQYPALERRVTRVEAALARRQPPAPTWERANAPTLQDDPATLRQVMALLVESGAYVNARWWRRLVDAPRAHVPPPDAPPGWGERQPDEDEDENEDADDKDADEQPAAVLATQETETPNDGDATYHADYDLE